MISHESDELKSLELQKEDLKKKEIELLIEEKKLLEVSSRQQWLYFSVAYLDIAECGCDNLLNKADKGMLDKFIVIPVIYNVKHALEIILKYLTKIGEKENYERIHNLKKLFLTVKVGIDKAIRKRKDRL